MAETQIVKDFQYFNTIPVKQGAVTELDIIIDDSGIIWVKVLTDTGQKFLVPHHTIGEPLHEQ